MTRPWPGRARIDATWLLSAAWLVFLMFPVMALWRQPLAVPWRVGGLVLLAVFGVIFVAGCQQGWAFADRPPLREPLIGLGLLVAVAAVLAVMLRADVLSLAPFLIAYACFALPQRPMVATLAVAWLVTAAVPVITGQVSLWAITVGVTVTCVMTRELFLRSQEAAHMREALRVATERERVARDVHDVLGHSLTAIAVKTQLAAKLIDRDAERTRAELAEIAELTQTAIGEIRETVGGLRVAVLTDEIAAAEKSLTAAGIAAELPSDPTVVDPRHRTLLAWVLREAVTNVVRHSRAHRCHVTLASAGLTVTDDGRGFAGREGHGLRGMRERVEQAGGTLTIGPATGGRGTTVAVTL